MKKKETEQSQPDLPTWVSRPDNLPTSGDQQTDNIGVHFAIAYKFDLVGFDTWLSSLEPCGARVELLERRALAIAAVGGRDEQRRHLEWMMLRMSAIQRESALLPLARRDNKRQLGTKKERRPEVTAWINLQLSLTPDAKSPELWARRPQWLDDQLGIRRFAERVSKCRKLRASK